MKMIPAGLHLLVFGTDADRIGVFLRLGASETRVLKWDASTELLLPIAGEEAQPHVHATGSLAYDSRLGPYPLGTWDEWVGLSDRIDEGVLRRAGLPMGTLVAPSCADDLDLSSVSVREGARAPAEAHAATDAAAPAAEGSSSPAPTGTAATTPSPSSASASFVELDPRARRTDGGRGVGGRTGRELTAFLLDRSEWLTQLLEQDYFADPAAAPPADTGAPDRGLPPAESSLLGELQLAFLLFLRLSCLVSLEAWKKRVHLLCACDAALGALGDDDDMLTPKGPPPPPPPPPHSS